MNKNDKEVMEVATMAQSNGWGYVRDHIEKRIEIIEQDLLEKEELELVERIALQKERKSLLGIINFINRRYKKAVNS